MIESITIKNVATYGNVDEQMLGLSKFNFIYGSNGSGKTTISRVIANPESFPECAVAWKGGTKLQPMVYNPDFIARNFSQVSELKGVFTLGENQVDTLAKIAAAKGELDSLNKGIESLTQTLQGADGAGGKKNELVKLETAFKEKAWTQKLKLDGKSAQDALKGTMGSKDSFKTKILQESTTNKALLSPLAKLEKKAESIFAQAPTTAVLVPVIDTTKLLAHANNPILKKRVVGKEDVDIAAMIKKLGNSDWVRQGREFYEVNNETCPFCQQSTTEGFTQSLNEYFDEAFLADKEAIDKLASDYATDASRLKQQIEAIFVSQPKFLDIEKLEIEKTLLDAKIDLNNQHLVRKKKEASQVVALESLSNVIAAINLLIDSANSQVVEHNKMVANITAERSALTAQVWKYVIEELKDDINTFKNNENGLSKAIDSLSTQISGTRSKQGEKTAEIRELEKQTTSVQPTIDAINGLLASFGFQGFTLAKATNDTSYKLVRPDGSDAKATLSEGEKTFITFLYFYHLLKGSDSDSGMTTDRVVVFDDPVSSLDSDVLFLVSSLIKKLFEEVRANIGHVKQVFVFTHNVYFHKEIAFNPDRTKDKAMTEETFWFVRKPDLTSKIEKCESNPIKTSYDLLWAELRREDKSSLTIQNTLRRILENYFKILGGVDINKLCDKFDGKEKPICKSLFSWVNDGSHFAMDDLYVSIDEGVVNTYLNVFKRIFEKEGHLAHYKMMMGEAYIEALEDELAT